MSDRPWRPVARLQTVQHAFGAIHCLHAECGARWSVISLRLATRQARSAVPALRRICAGPAQVASALTCQVLPRAPRAAGAGNGTGLWRV
eukprot:1261938-Prymnesium_polylepis.2